MFDSAFLAMFQHPPTISSEDQDMQLHFIVQDRPVVVGLGLAAWRGQCPEMLESRQVVFQGKPSVQPPSHNTARPLFRAGGRATGSAG
jgi:hypothetical protein